MTRLCRFLHHQHIAIGLYYDTQIVPLQAAQRAYADTCDEVISLGNSGDLLDLLPPNDEAAAQVERLYAWAAPPGVALPQEKILATSNVRLLVPIPRPNKLFLLAGNYAAHVAESKMIVAERKETFPWVFMKPPSTTLTDPGESIRLPRVSPSRIDYELELAIIIGRHVKGVTEREALDCVAGYTIINDISDRQFRPNPNRKQRERDKFFDWLHGKWHDSFCPCGPCITSRRTIQDPQKLSMKLTVNGELRQSASTAHQIFPVAAVVEFISSFVTLEPGDIISTGTPAGVGHANGIYLRAGDQMEATIDSIGTLLTTVVDEGPVAK